jgi:hypothetical protein
METAVQLYISITINNVKSPRVINLHSKQLFSRIIRNKANKQPYYDALMKINNAYIAMSYDDKRLIGFIFGVVAIDNSSVVLYIYPQEVEYFKRR